MKQLPTYKCNNHLCYTQGIKPELFTVRKSMDEKMIKEVLLFYKKNARHTLPFRHKISPYRILVSEIMLQQTQVNRVIEKFLSWMKTYPTLGSLKNASLKDILILWQRLGYQRRAKALLTIASTCTKVPKTFNELRTLPGVGKYTAAAICAFAYDLFSYPVLETNIRTTLMYFFHKNEKEIKDEIFYNDLIRLEKNKKVIRIGARHWYYALMDYGAMLKEKGQSYNAHMVSFKKQTPYKGSFRELRAKVLFAITHKTPLPGDTRTSKAILFLLKEKFIIKKGRHYFIVS